MECRQTMRQLTDATYLCVEQKPLQQLLSTLQEALVSIRLHLPADAELALNVKQTMTKTEKVQKVQQNDTYEQIQLIKTAIRYDSASDCFVGTEEYGSVGGRGKGLTSQALVVMVHGLMHKWKQALGYFLASGRTKAVMLKNIVCSATDMISGIGGTVVAITCDQGANNRALFSNLGVTVKNPFLFTILQKYFASMIRHIYSKVFETT